MLYTIDEIRVKTVPIAKSFGIKSVSLFGSYARGDASSNSDVDLYIEKGKLRSLFQYFEFVHALEKELGCHVDVVTTDINDTHFLSKITKEGVLIYES